MVGERLFSAAGAISPPLRSGSQEVGPRVVWLLFAIVSLLYVYAACIDLGFSADGAYFFMRALDDRKTLVP
jgi:hypothetical protein